MPSTARCASRHGEKLYRIATSAAWRTWKPCPPLSGKPSSPCLSRSRAPRPPSSTARTTWTWFFPHQRLLSYEGFTIARGRDVISASTMAPLKRRKISSETKIKKNHGRKVARAASEPQDSSGFARYAASFLDAARTAVIPGGLIPSPYSPSDVLGLSRSLYRSGRTQPGKRARWGCVMSLVQIHRPPFLLRTRQPPLLPQA